MTDFLIGNPGIQGSNLVCRLSVLLEAGLFDESLPSCTDRDLCIRIAELPGVRYGTTSEPSVHHFACESRDRLSTPGAPSRNEGLDRFFLKYRDRMSDAERKKFRVRAERYFGWRESTHEPLTGGDPDHVPFAVAPGPRTRHSRVGGHLALERGLDALGPGKPAGATANEERP